MGSAEIFNSLIAELEQTSSEEVQRISKEKGITIPDEPRLSDLFYNFSFDLYGLFNESINSYKPPKFDKSNFTIRKSIVIPQNPSRQKAALLVS